jgi:hypothetical protein
MASQLGLASRSQGKAGLVGTDHILSPEISGKETSILIEFQ